MAGQQRETQYISSAAMASHIRPKHARLGRWQHSAAEISEHSTQICGTEFILPRVFEGC